MLKFYPTDRFLEVVRGNLTNESGGTPIALSDDLSKVMLIGNNVTPGPEITIEDLVLVSSNGLAAKSLVAGNQIHGVDPLNGDSVIALKEAAGGWRFTATSAPEDTLNIRGIALVDVDATYLFGVWMFDSPVPISQVGHFVDPGKLEIRFGASSFR